MDVFLKVLTQDLLFFSSIKISRLCIFPFIPVFTVTVINIIYSLSDDFVSKTQKQ
jgi:hypothetical protein